MERHGANIKALLILALAAAPAAAHRPYAVKEKEIQGPQGQPLVVEKLFGDGIFSADPVSLQIRTKEGAVIAYTAVSPHVGVYCPSVSDCWAFPHDSLMGIVTAMHLDDTALDFNKQLGPEEKGVIVEKAGTTYGFENPISRKEPLGFKQDRSLIMKAVGPYFVIRDHLGLLIFLALLCILPQALSAAEPKLTASRRSTEQTAIKFIIRALYTVDIVLLLGLSYLILSMVAPWSYALAVAGLSLWASRRYLQRPP